MSPRRLTNRLLPHTLAAIVPNRPSTAWDPGRGLDRQLVGAWLSLVEHLVRDQGVGGSNPLAPTNKISRLKAFGYLHLLKFEVLTDYRFDYTAYN